VSFFADIWGWLQGLDVRVWQAVIAGTFVAFGWVYNGWQVRRETASLRAERLRDVHRALYAEIGANLANLADQGALSEQADAVVAQMRAVPEYVPFLPREDRTVVFQSIVKEIHVLPRTTINAIVAYYAQLTAISALIDDIRSDAYAALTVTRKIAVYEDLMRLKQQALAFGDHALLMIKTYGDEGPEAAKALERKLRAVNIQPAVDRSAP